MSHDMFFLPQNSSSLQERRSNALVSMGVRLVEPKDWLQNVLQLVQNNNCISKSLQNSPNNTRE